MDRQTDSRTGGQAQRQQGDFKVSHIFLKKERRLKAPCIFPTECLYVVNVIHIAYKTKQKLRGFSPSANYTDRATATCRQVSANFSG
jgi:hypothetical protein